MTNLRRYGVVLLTISIILSWTTGALAGKSFLRYDNGTIVETWSAIKDDVETPYSGNGRTVTLDVRAEIWDAETLKPVSEVYPGQKVILWCMFNRLGDLEVPFDQLIGHEAVFNYILIGALRFRRGLIRSIEDHQDWSGTGISYTVPNDALDWKFLYLTKMRIRGFRNKNRWDFGVYSVAK